MTVHKSALSLFNSVGAWFQIVSKLPGCLTKYVWMMIFEFSQLVTQGPAPSPLSMSHSCYSALPTPRPVALHSHVAMHML